MTGRKFLCPNGWLRLRNTKQVWKKGRETIRVLPTALDPRGTRSVWLLTFHSDPILIGVTALKGTPANNEAREIAKKYMIEGTIPTPAQPSQEAALS